MVLSQTILSSKTCSFHGKTKGLAISIHNCIHSCLISMQPKVPYLGAPIPRLALHFLACWDDGHHRNPVRSMKYLWYPENNFKSVKMILSIMLSVIIHDSWRQCCWFSLTIQVDNEWLCQCCWLLLYFMLFFTALLCI